MIGKVIKDVDVFVDGRGYAGEAEEFEPPKLNIKTEEYRPAGFDVPVEMDMGMEKMECTLSTIGLDKELLKLWGLTSGEPKALVLRASQEDDRGAVESIRIDLRGRGKGIDYGTWKKGERMPMKIMFSLVYYKCEIDGETLHEIDAESMIRIIGGVDQLAARRAALGRT